jgi:hypothetical protein
MAINNTPPDPRSTESWTPESRRDVGKEIDRATPSPEVARRAAKDIERHGAGQMPSGKTTREELDEDLINERSGDPSIHEKVFGRDSEKAYDDTPPGAGHRQVNPIGTAVQPEGFQPMRNVGDSDQGDRQPDGGRRR